MRHGHADGEATVQMDGCCLRAWATAKNVPHDGKAMECSGDDSDSGSDVALIYGAAVPSILQDEQFRHIGHQPPLCAVRRSPVKIRILVSFVHNERKLTALVWTCCPHCYKDGFPADNANFWYVVSSDETFVQIYNARAQGTLQNAPVFEEVFAMSDDELFTMNFPDARLMRPLYPDGITRSETVDRLVASVINPVMQTISNSVLVPQSAHDLQDNALRGNMSGIDKYVSRFASLADGTGSAGQPVTPDEVASIIIDADAHRKRAWQRFKRNTASFSDVPVNKSRELTPEQADAVQLYTNENFTRVHVLQRLALLLLFASCFQGTYEQFDAALRCVRWMYGRELPHTVEDQGPARTLQEVARKLLKANNTLSDRERNTAERYVFTASYLQS